MAPQTQMHDDIFSLASNNETVKLNVGGKRYETSWAVISSVEKLSALAYERWVEDPEDEIFVDRDGIRFRYCLDYFRDGKVVIPRSETRESILNDLKYFGVASPDTDAIQYAEDFDDGSEEKKLPFTDTQATHDLTQAMNCIFDNFEELDNEIERRSSKQASLVFVQAVVAHLLNPAEGPSFAATRTLIISSSNKFYNQARKVYDQMTSAKAPSPSKADLIKDFYIYAGLKLESISYGITTGNYPIVIKFKKE